MDLIHRKIDNELSADEEKQLEIILKSNNEAQKEFDSISKLSGFFRTSEATPPSELKTDVMARVKAIQSSKAVAGESIITKVNNSFKSLLTPKSAFPFAIGAIAALLVMTFVFKPAEIFNSIDSNGYSGTFVFNSVEDIPLQVHSQVIESIPGDNLITVSQVNQLSAIRIQFDTKKPIKFDFSIKSPSTRFAAFERSDDASGIINVQTNVITIDRHNGKGVYSFFYQNPTKAPFVIDYRIVSEGVDISEKINIE